jgi:hypothetical protein
MSDKNNDQQNVVRRRGFLVGAVSTGAVGAAVVASGVLSTNSAIPDIAKDDNASKGYQVSEHVRRYYRTTTV